MIQCGLEGASEALAGLYIDSGVLRCGLRSSSVWANGEAGLTWLRPMRILVIVANEKAWRAGANQSSLFADGLSTLSKVHALDSETAQHRIYKLRLYIRAKLTIGVKRSRTHKYNSLHENRLTLWRIFISETIVKECKDTRIHATIPIFRKARFSALFYRICQ